MPAVFFPASGSARAWIVTRACPFAQFQSEWIAEFGDGGVASGPSSASLLDCAQIALLGSPAP